MNVVKDKKKYNMINWKESWAGGEILFLFFIDRFHRNSKKYAF